jgi:hypothetical protein
MLDFPEKDYLLRRISRFIEEEQLIIMKAYADGIVNFRDSVSTDNPYDSYLEYYNKNYIECSQQGL